MNYYGAKELASSFRTVRKNTIAIAQDIPEEKYSFRPAPDTRSVGELLAHISVSDSFQHQIHAHETGSSCNENAATFTHKQRTPDSNSRAGAA